MVFPFFKVTITVPKPPPAGYPVNPKTLGEHLRKKRIDSGLKQRELAKILNVSHSSVGGWERGISYPVCKSIPRIIGFLGYNPLPDPKDLPLPEQITMYRQIQGMTQKELAKQLNVDTDTVRRWELGLSQPSKPYRSAISSLLEKLLEECCVADESLTALTQEGISDNKSKETASRAIVGMEQLLSILGVRDKEDVITDLLAHRINADLAFARIFLATVCGSATTYTSVRVETQIAIPGIGVSDLVITADDGTISDLFVIENKVKAEEKDGQP